MNKNHLKRLVLCLISANFMLVPVSYAQETVYRADINKDGIQVIEITGGGYFFNPEHIIVKANVPVELSIKKESSFIPHNITMDETDAGIEFEESLDTEPKTIKFTPTVKGKFPFYCDGQFLFFESHRVKGMEGIIEVVE